MVRTLTCLALLMLGLPALADSTLPRDVQKFVERRDGCDHIRGEIPDSSEKQRKKELNREIENLCKGTDKQLAQLKKKYARNASVMRLLNEFEDIIEASVAPLSESRAVRKVG